MGIVARCKFIHDKRSKLNRVYRNRKTSGQKTFKIFVSDIKKLLVFIRARIFLIFINFRELNQLIIGNKQILLTQAKSKLLLCYKVWKISEWALRGLCAIYSIEICQKIHTLFVSNFYDGKNNGKNLESNPLLNSFVLWFNEVLSLS